MPHRWNARMIGVVGVVVVLVAGLTAGRAPSQRPMGVVDLLNVPRILDPQISPDGRELLFTRTEADWKNGRRTTYLWRARLDASPGDKPSRLTEGTATEGGARWSPDGKTIAFVTAGGESGQVFLLAASGGEPRQLTKHATGVSNVSWTADGSALLFTAAEPRTPEERTKEKARDDVYAYGQTYKQAHLWKVEVATGAETRITRGDFSVGSYALSEDGRKIVYQRAPTPLLDEMERAELWIADADGSGALRLTTNNVVENSIQVAADNSRVLFVAKANGALQGYHNGRLFVVPATGGPARAIVGDKEPLDVDRAIWARDGKSIYFMANLGVHEQLFTVSAGGDGLRQLTKGPQSVVLWSRTNDRLALTVHDSSSDGDVWVLGAGTDAPTRVTHVFDYLARDFALGRQEAISWRGADGKTVEGLLTYPVGYERGRRYPLVVMIHGGPDQSDKYSIGSTTYQIQVFAGRGYAVLQPNHRGSAGYGDFFLRDMIGRYFRNSHLDVLAGVDEVVRRGVADPDKLVTMGWSAGAHMTNKLITATTRFKAAASGAGVADWVSMYAQSDIRTPRTPWFGGTPWQKSAPIDAYWKNSPLRDVAAVRTPTIFFVGERDTRVGMSQSLMMYHALRDSGVPTTLYVAPREPHTWNELRHILFKMNAEIDWFEKHATGRPYVWEKAPSDN